MTKANSTITNYSKVESGARNRVHANGSTTSILAALANTTALFV